MRGQAYLCFTLCRQAWLASFRVRYITIREADKYSEDLNELCVCVGGVCHLEAKQTCQRWLIHSRFNKDAIHYKLLRSANVRVSHSPAIIVPVIGRHMEPGGWSEERGREGDRKGDAWSLGGARQQKRAETAALSTVHTIKALWNKRSGGGEVPKKTPSLQRSEGLHSFGARGFSLSGNAAAQLWKQRVKHELSTQPCIYLEAFTDARWPSHSALLWGWSE